MKDKLYGIIKPFNLIDLDNSSLSKSAIKNIVNDLIINNYRLDITFDNWNDFKIINTFIINISWFILNDYIKEIEPVFNPIELTLTINSQSEFDDLLARMNTLEELGNIDYGFNRPIVIGDSDNLFNQIEKEWKKHEENR